MNLLPKVKECKIITGTVDISKIKWNFCDATDERIKSAAYRIAKNCDDGILVTIKHGEKDDESYKIEIKDEILISASGAAGAFYALQTLDMLREEDCGIVECCEIYDYPDMQYRGFYHDITRGQIPNLDRLKSLVDDLARFKINSLQLYVEHTYEFKEYAYLNGSLGYITKAEIMELDEYCKERFVELVPSVATFGHIYHLMESPEYKHLCELADYVPTEHYYIERLKHHTINPLLEESFSVITSIIDQFLEAFTSDKFNICCDETVDLCKGVNKDKAEQKGRMYVDFVKKLVNYIKSTGKVKTIMMWGDIAIRHLDCIHEIPDDVILLDWDYAAEPPEDTREAFRALNRKLIVAPGVCSWYDFGENIKVSEKNIKSMAEHGYKANALGILNTNWGDYGHIASLESVYHGIIFGAVVGWDKTAVSDDEFKKTASQLYYGNEEAIPVLNDLSDVKIHYSWGRLIRPGYDPGPLGKTKAELDEMIKTCQNLRERIKKATFKSERVKNELIVTVDGHALFLKWLGIKDGINVDCYVDFDAWLSDYTQNWLRVNKRGELDELIRLFKVLESRKESSDYKKETKDDEVVKLYPDIKK